MAGVVVLVVVLAILVVMAVVVMAVAWICIVRARRTQRKSMIQGLYYIMEIAIKVFILQLEENKSHLKLDNGIASNSSNINHDLTCIVCIGKSFNISDLESVTAYTYSNKSTL